MKNRLLRCMRSKKGAALESAIFFLVIVFSLCFLMTSTALMGRYQSKIDAARHSADLELEQLTEDFLAYAGKDGGVAGGGSGTFTSSLSDKYEFEVKSSPEPGGAGTTYTLTAKRKVGDKVVLYLAAEKSSDGVKLTSRRTDGTVPEGAAAPEES